VRAMKASTGNLTVEDDAAAATHAAHDTSATGCEALYVMAQQDIYMSVLRRVLQQVTTA
jgi:hypothetical protein